jgi:hypothetical protein
VRENRLHGSEGGAAHARPYPYVPPGGAAHLPVKIRSLSIALGQGS